MIKISFPSKEKSLTNLFVFQNTESVTIYDESLTSFTAWTLMAMGTSHIHFLSSGSCIFVHMRNSNGPRAVE